MVRRADASAASVNEWTGERLSRDADVAEDVKPASVAPLGNYAVRPGPIPYTLYTLYTLRPGPKV